MRYYKFKKEHSRLSDCLWNLYEKAISQAFIIDLIYSFIPWGYGDIVMLRVWRGGGQILSERYMYFVVQKTTSKGHHFYIFEVITYLIFTYQVFKVCKVNYERQNCRSVFAIPQDNWIFCAFKQLDKSSKQCWFKECKCLIFFFHRRQ